MIKRKNFENNNIKTTQTTQIIQIKSIKLNDTQIKMLEMIMKDNKITREKLAFLLKKLTKTIILLYN